MIFQLSIDECGIEDIPRPIHPTLEPLIVPKVNGQGALTWTCPVLWVKVGRKICCGVLDTELLPHSVLWSLVIESTCPSRVLIFVPVNWKTYCNGEKHRVEALTSTNLKLNHGTHVKKSSKQMRPHQLSTE